MVSAPLVMPEVIVGLSLLLMLVSVQRALGSRSAAPSRSG
jgi:putrescine transport system permease protein